MLAEGAKTAFLVRLMMAEAVGLSGQRMPMVLFLYRILKVSGVRVCFWWFSWSFVSWKTIVRGPGQRFSISFFVCKFIFGM